MSARNRAATAVPTSGVAADEDRRKSAPPKLPPSLQSGFFSSSNMSVLTSSEQLLVDLLLDLGQDHVFAGWDRAGVNDDKKHEMLAQVARLDQGYPGGLRGYVSNARKLLVDAKAGVNPFDGWAPSMPTGTHLTPYDGAFVSSEGTGLLELPFTGFVLVAGGLGERLGYGDIKIGLPVETTTRTTYLEYYCRCIKAMEARYCRQGQSLPLAIMVSGDTLQGTRAAVAAVSAWFPDITIMLQEKVAALVDNDCALAMSGPYEIDAKPHGHGDVHCLMHSTGTAQAWLQRGVRWCVFFQDTNALAFHTLPAMLGVSRERSLEVNSLAVPRVAQQAVGAIVKLGHADGRDMTINVEYNQLDPLLRATVSPDGDVNEAATGNSPYPGNINQLVFRLEPYCATLARTQGLLAEFVNPKYADASKQKFKKPTRLECMMQDYPKILPAASNVGFTQAPAWLCYSPCKNNAADAAASIAQGVPAGAAWTAESDQYQCKAEMLRLLGARVDRGPDATFLGISAPAGPRIVVDPGTALFFSELRAVFPCPSAVHITARSTLVLQGDVVVESLSLDGRLRVVAAPGTRIVVRAGRGAVVNAGDALLAIASGDAAAASAAVAAGGVQRYGEVDAMRGFVLRTEAEELVASVAPTGGEGRAQKSEAVCCCLGLCSGGCGTWHDSGVDPEAVFVFTGPGRPLVPASGETCCSLFC